MPPTLSIVIVFLYRKATGKKLFMVRGLERSGTNYLCALLRKRDYYALNEFIKNESSYFHKHYRFGGVVNWRSAVLKARYKSKGWQKYFDLILVKLMRIQTVYVIKDERAWIESFSRHGLRFEWWDASRLEVDKENMRDDYFLYLDKVRALTLNNPKSLIVSYDEVIDSADNRILSDFFLVKKFSKKDVVINKVPMSNEFTR